MKKFLSALILLSFLVVLVVPMTASAQAGPPECVKLRRDITVDSQKFPAKATVDGTTYDQVYVGSSGGYCPHLKDKKMPTTAEADKLITGTAGQPDAVYGKIVKDKNDKDVIAIPNPKWGLISLINTLQTVVDWIFTILIALAVLFVIMGAFQIVTAGGDPGKVTTGRTYILYAAIGLIVAFIARAIPSLVKSVMGY